MEEINPHFLHFVREERKTQKKRGKMVMVWKGLKLRPPAVKPLKTGAINKKAPTTGVAEALK
ncbi:hypothetical protein [Endozoicomonas sp. Mp262]|uniref:hypothetical protein n=1 Tax=Endozoicomonas sp. Mp262 TaxID=2919499 RepID=UPI0021D87302